MVKGRSGKRKKWFNFASDLDHYLDLLDSTEGIRTARSVSLVCTLVDLPVQ